MDINTSVSSRLQSFANLILVPTRKRSSSDRRCAHLSQPTRLTGDDLPPDGALLHPAQVLQSDRVVPDLGHMADPVTIEVHDVHVVRSHTFARRRDGTTLSGVRP